MKRILAALALVALFVARDTPAAAPTYMVTWTLVIVHDVNYPLRMLTGLGAVAIWTYSPLQPDGKPRTQRPLDGETRLYNLYVPISCAGRERCVLATLPLPDPDVLRRIIIYSWVPDEWPLQDAATDVQATVTQLAGPI